ncbi:MAG: hypothetical protein PHH54_03260 [Candidatus Nanoarchaeia archaeon]|nr:hypothetical protein [Candidatus Nanoarchaeia archaeon]MDD5740975.1 hypothetical protein [Candidatus Nanoarchaeia archaeon]
MGHFIFRNKYYSQYSTQGDYNSVEEDRLSQQYDDEERTYEEAILKYLTKAEKKSPGSTHTLINILDSFKIALGGKSPRDCLEKDQIEDMKEDTKSSLKGLIDKGEVEKINNRYRIRSRKGRE